MVLGFFLRTIVVVVAEDEPKRRRIRPKISDSFQNAQLGAQFPVWNFSELNWAPKSLKNSPIDLGLTLVEGASYLGAQPKQELLFFPGGFPPGPPKPVLLIFPGGSPRAPPGKRIFLLCCALCVVGVGRW